MRNRLSAIISLAFLLVQPVIAQPNFRIDKYMTEEEKRSCGLSKLTPEELNQLNLHFSRQIEIALKTGQEVVDTDEPQRDTSPRGNVDVSFGELEGAAVIAEDETFLGVISSDRSNSKSLSNQYGTYGSKYNSDSIWNQYGTYGGRYSSQSPFNPYTSTPPRIYLGRRFVGYLTVNKALTPRVDPAALQAWVQSQ